MRDIYKIYNSNTSKTWKATLSLMNVCSKYKMKVHPKLFWRDENRDQSSAYQVVLRLNFSASPASAPNRLSTGE